MGQKLATIIIMDNSTLVAKIQGLLLAWVPKLVVDYLKKYTYKPLFGGFWCEVLKEYPLTPCLSPKVIVF